MFNSNSSVTITVYVFFIMLIIMSGELYTYYKENINNFDLSAYDLQKHNPFMEIPISSIS